MFKCLRTIGIVSIAVSAIFSTSTKVSRLVIFKIAPNVWTAGPTSRMTSIGNLNHEPRNDSTSETIFD